jgi:hypothetical protein
MRKLWGGTFAVLACLGLAGAVRSGDAEKARAIVNKAIQAMGGEKNLAKHQAITWKEKGTYYGMGEGIPYTANFAVQAPNQFRMDVEGVFIIVLDGAKGWMSVGGESKELPKDQLAMHIKTRKAGWVATLVPLQDKAFQLTLLDEVNIDKQPAAGVKVTRADYPDVKLYFDKKTNLLLKSEFRGQTPDQPKEITQEAYYHDYRNIDGTQVPRRIVLKHDGKLFVDAESHDYKAHGKLDAKHFAKP